MWEPRGMSGAASWMGQNGPSSVPSGRLDAGIDAVIVVPLLPAAGLDAVLEPRLLEQPLPRPLGQDAVAAAVEVAQDDLVLLGREAAFAEIGLAFREQFGVV